MDLGQGNTLAKIKSAVSEKQLNLVLNKNWKLDQLRKQILESELGIAQFMILMPDKTPISKTAEKFLTADKVLIDGCVFVLEKVYNSDADAQSQNFFDTERKQFQILQEKGNDLKARLDELKITLTNLLPHLPSFGNYKGQMVNGKYHGLGLYTYDTGETHRGYFKNGMRHGLGIYTFLNGDTYQGQYENDVANGIGSEYFINGNRMIAEYFDNCANGLGIYYYADGTKLQGNFESNMATGLCKQFKTDGTWVMKNYVDGNEAEVPENLK